jgi:site-specific recombinase XerD
LDDQVVDRFLRFRRRQQRVARGDPKALDRMLSMLRQKGIVKPCQPAVADARSAYLRRDRPPSVSRRVFLRHRAPLAGFANPSTLSSIVRRALKHAGVESAHMGAHVLRHSLATSMLRQGGSLDEIGELLRHQSPNTTAIYAKVDVTALHTLALPWPGGGR